MKTDKEQDIKRFAYSENSMMQKAKRYDEDIKYLLDTLYNERRRHAACEEEMIMHDPAEISKVLRLELLDNIVKLINEHYDEPFHDFEKLEYFKNYCDGELINQILNDHSYVGEKKLLGHILKLITEHFNRPSAC